MELHQPTFNRICGDRTVQVSALVTAYDFDRRQAAAPYWEQYDFSQIFLVLAGSGVYQTEDAVYSLEPGMMFYRPANRRSCYDWSTEQVRFALISFVCDSPAMAALEGAPIRLHEEEQASLLDVIRTATRICEPVRETEPLLGMRVRENVPDEVLCFLYASLERFLSMVFCRLRQIDLLLDESRTVGSYLEESKTVAGIRKYLADHLTGQLSLQALSRHFGQSERTLLQLFRRETNRSIMDYYAELKIEEAKRRIRSGKESFTAIAEALGFSSGSYFSKAFKARTGMTPTAYSRHVSKRRAGARLEIP